MLDPKIETFIKVIETGSYTVAAQLLHVTQPAVTQHIHKLENHYGCKLIDSSHRAVKPTEAGMRLYEYLGLQQSNERRFSQLLRNTTPPLCVGATLSIADYYLPEPLVSHMLAGSGSERIRVTVGNTARLLSDLQKGELDCAFIEGLFDTALLETRVLCHAPFLAVVSHQHPLAWEGGPVSLEQLHRYPLVLREPQSGTREILENWLHQQNDGPRGFSQVIELGSFVLIKELVRRSSAVTFVYEAVVKKELQEGSLCALGVEDFQVTHPLRFVFRKGDPRRGLMVRFFETLSGQG